MTKLFIFISFIVTQTIFSTTVVNNEIVLPEEYVPKSTYSGDISDNKSFHLIFTKNNKDNKFYAFTYINNGNDIIELPSFSSIKESSIVSYHNDSNNLSLIVNVVLKDKSFFKIINYDLKTKKSAESLLFANDHYLASIKQNNTSILIYKYDTFLKLVTIKGSNKPTEKTITLDNKLNLFFKNQSISSVKSNDYVFYGATETIRIYTYDNVLYFTRDSKEPLDLQKETIIPLFKFRYNVVQTLKIDLNKDDLSPVLNTFYNEDKLPYKKSTSYLYKDKLIHLEFSKKKGVVNFYDLKTNKFIISISIENLFEDFTKSNNDFIGISNYLKLANKSDLLPTLVVNETVDNKLRVRLDYVKTNFKYNYDWMLYHQDFYSFHYQQILLNEDTQKSIKESFDLTKPDDIAFEKTSLIPSKYSFEILFDKNGKLLNSKFPETMYKVNNRYDYVSELEENDSFRFVSSTHLKDNFRALVYIKHLNKFFFKTKYF